MSDRRFEWIESLDEAPGGWTLLDVRGPWVHSTEQAPGWFIKEFHIWSGHQFLNCYFSHWCAKQPDVAVMKLKTSIQTLGLAFRLVWHMSAKWHPLWYWLVHSKVWRTKALKSPSLLWQARKCCASIARLIFRQTCGTCLRLLQQPQSHKSACKVPTKPCVFISVETVNHCPFQP